MPMRPLTLGLVLLTTVAVPASVPAIQPARTKVRIGRTRVRVATPAVSAEVRRAPFQLRVRLGRKLLVQERAGAGLFYERAGVTHALGDVRDARPTADGAELDVATDEDRIATITLRFTTRRTLEVSSIRPIRRASPLVTPGSLRRTASGSPMPARIPVLAPGVLIRPRTTSGRRRSDRSTAAARLSRCACCPRSRLRAVLPVVAGYGLSVAGTTFGVARPGEGDPEDNRPASRPAATRGSSSPLAGRTMRRS
jgi:hypothetical protein